LARALNIDRVSGPGVQRARIGVIVVAARSMIDAMTARCPTSGLQVAQLAKKPCVVWHLNRFCVGEQEKV
jgi:hypothetical protein